MKQRIILTILLCVLLLGTVPTAAAAELAAGGSPFPDVPAGAYYAHAVAWAVAHGVTRGTTETTFSPGVPCTRAQAVTFLWRAMGSPEPGSPPSTVPDFPDVAAGSYYEKAVTWAVENRVTGGTSPLTFSPQQPCTRAQIVTFLYRLATSTQTDSASSVPQTDSASGVPQTGTASNFQDVAPDAYYANAVAWAVAHGVTKGTSDTAFSPSTPCTRAQIVTFLYRFAGNAAESPNEESVSPAPSETVPSAQAPSETVPSAPPSPQPPAYDKTVAAERLREKLLSTIEGVANGGGYFTSHSPNKTFPRTSWDGLHAAYTISGNRPVIRLEEARPSFCSEACYLVLMKALLDWDTEGTISRAAWVNLKPWCLDNLQWPYQHDGMGCWGRANANGPGLAVLLAQLGAGESRYIGNPDEYASRSAYWDAWQGAEPGDFLKIFWNNAIGADDTRKEKAESGHLVVYLGREVSYQSDGTRDDWISYWSSNGSGSQADGGYGKSRCRASKIYRAVLTHVTDPAAFDNAANIAPDNTDPWLYALDGRRLATVEEMKAAITGADMSSWLR